MIPQIELSMSLHFYRTIKDRNGMDLTEAEEVARIHRGTVQKRASQPR